MTAEAAAKSYNQTYKNSKSVKMVKHLGRKNPEILKHFDKNIRDEEIIFPADETKPSSRRSHNINDSFKGTHEMHRKTLPNAFYTRLVVLELKDRNETGKNTFGPKLSNDNKLISKKESKEQYIASVNERVRSELYDHPEEKCYEPCKKAGCGRVFTSDGCWKISSWHW